MSSKCHVVVMQRSCRGHADVTSIEVRPLIKLSAVWPEQKAIIGLYRHQVGGWNPHQITIIPSLVPSLSLSISPSLSLFPFPRLYFLHSHTFVSINLVLHLYVILRFSSCCFLAFLIFKTNFLYIFICIHHGNAHLFFFTHFTVLHTTQDPCFPQCFNYEIWQNSNLGPIEEGLNQKTRQRSSRWIGGQNPCCQLAPQPFVSKRPGQNIQRGKGDG